MGTQVVPRRLMYLLPDSLGRKYLTVIQTALFIDVRGLPGQSFYGELAAIYACLND